MDIAGGWPIERVASCPSTNAELAHRALTGAVEPPIVLVADSQTAGQGRDGRDWITPPQGALTFSAFVRPEAPRSEWGLMPLWAGLACVQALAEFGFAASLKWPNDILLPADTPINGLGNWRKVGGILCQSVADKGVVIGIGINVTQAANQLPVTTATSLALASSNSPGSSQPPHIASLLSVIIEKLDAVLSDWQGGAGSALMRQYSQNCCSIGAQTTFSDNELGKVSGRGISINADGSLLVQLANGNKVACHAGDTWLV